MLSVNAGRLRPRSMSDPERQGLTLLGVSIRASLQHVLIEPRSVHDLWSCQSSCTIVELSNSEQSDGELRRQ